MTNQYALAKFTGFTEREVRQLCERYHMSFEQTKDWYDGYTVNGISIYNPRSVTSAMMNGIFDSCWTQTETYETLKKISDKYHVTFVLSISMDADELPECAKGDVIISL